jgi:glycosyltransferase 2 family protein
MLAESQFFYVSSFMQETVSTSSRSSQLFKLLLTMAVAVTFLWLAFTGADFKAILEHSQEVKAAPVLLVGISVLIGTFLRSYRWTLLLNPLRADSEEPIGQFNAFYAVLMGYAVNIVLPRGGEVVRLLSICKTERLPWAGVLATMLIDRMLDVALLAMLLGLTLFFLSGETITSVPGLITGGKILIIGALTGLCLLPHIGSIAKKGLDLDFVKRLLPTKLRSKLSELADQFNQGSGSLRSFARFPFIAFLSVLIWLTYWLNFYFMVLAFGLQDKITTIKCLIIFTIGSVGSLIPTPGSIGSIHYFVKLAAVETAQLSTEKALTFATISHLFIFIIFPSLLAAVVFLYKRIRRLQ